MKTTVQIIVITLLISGCWLSNNYYVPPEINDITEKYPKQGKVWIKLKNQERSDWFTRIDTVVYCGEIFCNVEPMKNIDVNSFEVIPNSNYAKDKNKIYYPIAIPCIDYSDCGVCWCAKYVLENAKSSTFEYLGNEYARDGKSVFFRGRLIKDADGETFQVVDGGYAFYFAKDKNYVFKHDEIFEEAEAKSFYYNKEDERNKTKTIVGDKNNEWEYHAPDKLIKLQKKTINCDSIFELGEQMPKFKGGDYELLEYTMKKIAPIIGRSNKRTGNLVSKLNYLLIISKEGKVLESEILSKVNKNLEDELKNELTNMPNWIPGKVNGQNECMKIRIPISCLKWE